MESKEFKGTKMIDIPATYLLWFNQEYSQKINGKLGQKVLNYIDDNMQALKLEMKRKTYPWK